MSASSTVLGVLHGGAAGGQDYSPDLAEFPSYLASATPGFYDYTGDPSSLTEIVEQFHP